MQAHVNLRLVLLRRSARPHPHQLLEELEEFLQLHALAGGNGAGGGGGEELKFQGFEVLAGGEGTGGGGGGGGGRDGGGGDGGSGATPLASAASLKKVGGSVA